MLVILNCIFLHDQNDGWNVQYLNPISFTRVFLIQSRNICSSINFTPQNIKYLFHSSLDNTQT
jgi:hypothetical protein